MRAAAEGHPGVFVPRLHRLGREAQRIEPVRIGPVFFHVVDKVRIDPDPRARRDGVAAEFEALQRAARDRRHRRDHPQRFLERHFGQLGLGQILVGQTAAIVRDRAQFLAQPVLPIGIFCQQVHQRRRTRRDGVVRRHHQEIHVVDDRFDAHQAAVFEFGGGELAEHVLPASLGPAAFGLAGEIVDEEGAAIDALLHLREGQRAAHRRDRGLDHVDEGLIDPVRFRPERQADETVRRQIERQLLDGGIELHIPRTPLVHPRGNPAIEAVRIMPHGAGLERDRQRAAIGAVMVEIEQHQPAGKQAMQHRAPPLIAGKDLRPVEQHQLVRLRPDQCDVPAAHGMDLVDGAIGLIHPPREGMRIGKLIERVADQRPAFFALNVVERFFRQAVAPALWREFDRLMRCYGGHGSLRITYTCVSTSQPGIHPASSRRNSPSSIVSPASEVLRQESAAKCSPPASLN